MFFKIKYTGNWEGGKIHESHDVDHWKQFIHCSTASLPIYVFITKSLPRSARWSPAKHWLFGGENAKGEETSRTFSVADFSQLNWKSSGLPHSHGFYRCIFASSVNIHRINKCCASNRKHCISCKSNSGFLDLSFQVLIFQGRLLLALADPKTHSMKVQMHPQVFLTNIYLNTQFLTSIEVLRGSSRHVCRSYSQEATAQEGNMDNSSRFYLLKNTRTGLPSFQVLITGGYSQDYCFKTREKAMLETKFSIVTHIPFSNLYPWVPERVIWKESCEKLEKQMVMPFFLKEWWAFRRGFSQ